jgi:hypothetical protein
MCEKFMHKQLTCGHDRCLREAFSTKKAACESLITRLTWQNMLKELENLADEEGIY